MSEDEILLTHILRCRPADLFGRRPVLTAPQERQFLEYKQRRRNGEPLQYITGSWDFYGLEFKIDRRVLVPRPETETLADLAIKRFRGARILDLGTGSGNLAVALAKFLPKARLTSVDISAGALALARENARKHGVQERIEFVEADMRALGDLGRAFDLVISNPPYVPSGQMGRLPLDVRQEPALALDGGPDGLDFLRAIINRSPRLLSRGGYLMMEFGDGQANAVKKLAEQKFTNAEIHKDLTERERVIICSGHTF